MSLCPYCLPFKKAKQIVVDGVYKVEQLAKENIEQQWNGLDKHTKAIQFISANLQKAGLNLSDEDIYDIIKSTDGIINEIKFLSLPQLCRILR